MRTINENSVADIFFQVRWKSELAEHAEWYLANRVNMWRDILPLSLRHGLLGRSTGDQVDVTLDAAELPWTATLGNKFQIKRSQFQPNGRFNGVSTPRAGRFYPKGLLTDVTNVFSVNVEPFRCVGVENGHLDVDFNHPLAGRSLNLSAVVGMVEEKQDERGGTSIDWLETLANGPGMQARWEGMRTDYFSETPFSREDESDDADFYGMPRLVQHIDDAAIDLIRGIYQRLLGDGMTVLDLMSSWQSHLPGTLKLNRLSGVGLNADELGKNPQLTDFVVLDLNRNHPLPYENGLFDAAICNVSVEYLTDPLRVFKEVGRVLKPEGSFIVTFSNRWFPQKAVTIWKSLHEFERMGLVSEYFFLSGAFEKINTYSARGVPRPVQDKYYPEFRYADPVYAVWGKRR